MREKYTRRLLLPALLSLLPIATLATISTGAGQHAYGTATSAGVVVPLYAYPGPTWDTIIQTKYANPSVPMVAIINPSNGPGSQDSNYASGIQRLQAAGITVLGYVHTSWGARDTGTLHTEMSEYKSWYNTNGIFFDEMANVAGVESYYSGLNSYAKSLGFTYTIGNPGADTLPSYIGTVDSIMIYENLGLPNISYLGGWHSSYSKSNFIIIPYGVGTLDTSYVASATSYVGYSYMTDHTLPTPWNTLPSYFGNLVSAVAASGPPGSPPPPPPPPPNTYTVAVHSADLAGTTITGLWTSVEQNGVALQSGYTPLSFSAHSGSTYQVTVGSYQTTVYNHWNDGSISAIRTISPTQSITLTSYYSTGTVTTRQPLLTVNTQDTSRNPINGYYTVLSESGNTFSTSFSPAKFSLNSGQTYTATVADYGKYAFDHWLDTGSTKRDRAISITTDTQITAVYKNIQSTPPPQQSTISVTTVDSKGSAIQGFYTTLWQNGRMVQSAFSPQSFTVSNGQTYQVKVVGHGIYVFDRWSDGTTTKMHTVKTGTGTTTKLTAVFRII